MTSSPPPTITFATLFENCAGRAPEATRLALISEKPALVVRSVEYDGLAATAALHSMADRTPVYTTAEALRDLYDVYLLSDHLRTSYSALRAAPRNLCPYCGQRVVATLDHYLPKSAFPDFSVHPHNLIPCCRDCNSSKLASIALIQENLALHPYFENWNQYRLLVAGMDFDPVAELFYGISENPSIPKLLRQRAGAHFDLFGLHCSTQLTVTRS